MMRSFACLSFVFILCQAPAAIGQEPAPRTITVTGSSTVRFYPDAARISFRIRNTEPTADEARQANQKAVKLADEKLSELKIKDLKVSFASATVSQQVDRVAQAGNFGAGPGARNPRGGAGGAVETVRSYSSSQAGTLILHETDKNKMANTIAKIEKSLVDMGVVSANVVVDDDSPTGVLSSGVTVTMFRSDDAEFHEEALTKAVQNALRKANAMAKGAGGKVKDTLSIVENEINAPIVLEGGRQGRSRSGPSPSLIPGELEITVRVTVKCSY